MNATGQVSPGSRDERATGPRVTDRYLVISSDCHAGLPPERYRDYVDPQYRDTFDIALPIQTEMTKSMEKTFLIADINEEWRKGREYQLTGPWDHDARLQGWDADGGW